MRIEKENPKNPKCKINEPMLFPRNPAKGGTSGPQACFFAEKIKNKSEGSKLDSSLERKGVKGYLGTTKP